MKKPIFLLALFFLTTVLQAQSLFPERGFSFQGYARDNSGAALASRNVSVRFTIYDQANATPPAYQETHNLATDSYGVFTAVVGSRTPGSFRNLDFSVVRYWMRTEVSPDGIAWTEISNTEMLAVPYAKAADNGVPPGTIMPFAGPVANIPVGYLPCDGTEFSRTDYPRLFAAIGTVWGGGPATFRVPNLMGRFLRGHGDASSPGGANAVGNYQNDEMRSHSHGMDVAGEHSHPVHKDPNVIEWWLWANGTRSVPFSTPAGFTGTVPPGSQDAMNLGNVQSNYFTLNAGGHTHNIQPTGGAETRPVNAAVFYIIKY